MMGSPVLEVVLGLSFCYASVALIVSTVQEALASALRLRAHSLLDGIKGMLNDPYFTALARAVYAHSLVNPQDDGRAADPRRLRFKPSYIEPLQFAIALVDVIQTAPGDYAQLGRDIDAIGAPQLRRTLRALYQRADGDLALFQDGVAGWFDSSMARVSGAYKRRQLLVSVLLALLLAILFNIDSIHLFRTLWQHPVLAAQVAAAPGTLDRQSIELLFTLPIGWNSFPPAFDQAFLMQAAGWLLTAATTLFGAPFWFDLLQRAIQLRGTGAKPAEKAKPALAAAIGSAGDGRR